MLFAWYDFWVGLFWDAKKHTLYFFPIPMLGLKIKIWGRRCYVLMKRGHFYRPGGAGYTDRLEEAGRFTLKEAQKFEYPYDEPVTKHHVNEFVF